MNTVLRHFWGYDEMTRNAAFSCSPRAIAKYLGAPVVSEPMPKLPRIVAKEPAKPQTARDRVWEYLRGNPSTSTNVRCDLNMAESTVKHALVKLGIEGRAQVIGENSRLGKIWEAIE